MTGAPYQIQKEVSNGVRITFKGCPSITDSCWRHIEIGEKTCCNILNLEQVHAPCIEELPLVNEAYASVNHNRGRGGLNLLAGEVDDNGLNGRATVDEQGGWWWCRDRVQLDGELGHVCSSSGFSS